MEIKKIIAESHSIATEKGWYDPPKSFGELIALVHSECSIPRFRRTVYMAAMGAREGSSDLISLIHMVRSAESVAASRAVGFGCKAGPN